MNQVKTINNNNNNNNNNDNNNNIITIIIITIQINYKHMSDKQASKKELNSSGFKEKLIYMTSNSKAKAKKKERERRQEDLRFIFSLGFRIHIEKTFLEVLRKYFPISKSLGCCYLQLN